MAVQALYRRYRPRRFSEVKGQEHVVRALRNAVINHREGQAYLFSGPRGTGKTTSARILAKVLNCEDPVDGEPCCACASCLAVEAGTSYDVHELDAASNNGVDAMRDLIDKAMLGTPGRHKVYILDEVHMLSKAAEAALLKTLEEPPPHVVFVLATTDPQKVSETIRSRTQHLQFHLLAMDVLEQHVRWLAEDAGLDVTESAIQTVLRRGGGSARDTLSALELVAATGTDDRDDVPLDEFVEAILGHDPARALAAVAEVMRFGRDARTLTENLLGHLRDCFLATMAPDLVQLPDRRAAEVVELGRRLGAAAAVRALETLGTMLVEMRFAPDPRVLLEVALVKLTSAAMDPSGAALVERVERLEAAIGGGASGPGSRVPAFGRPGSSPPTSRAAEDAASGSATSTTTVSSPDVDSPPQVSPRPAPGVTRSEHGEARDAGQGSTTESPRDPATGRAVLGGRLRRDDRSAPGGGSADGNVRGLPDRGTAVPGEDGPLAPVTPLRPDRMAPLGKEPVPAVSGASAPASRSVAGGTASDDLGALHTAVVASLRPLAKAVLSAGRFLSRDDQGVTLAVPSEPLRQRAGDQRSEIERVLAEVVGRSVRLTVVVDATVRTDDGLAMPTSAELPADDDVDIHDLLDAPREPTISPIDRLSSAFPGSQLVDEPD